MRTYELHQVIQPISMTMLELPLSRDLNLDHIPELHCSSLHHTKLQVISSKSNSIFQKKHTTSQIASGNIFCLSCTHLHAGLHPTKPRDHTWSHTEIAPRSALPINGTACPIRIHITLQVNVYDSPHTRAHNQLYPSGTSLHALQPSGEHVSMCSYQSKYMVSYSSGTSRNKSCDDTS